MCNPWNKAPIFGYVTLWKHGYSWLSVHYPAYVAHAELILCHSTAEQSGCQHDAWQSGFHCNPAPHICLKQKQIQVFIPQFPHLAIIHKHSKLLNECELKLLVFWKSFAHFCLLPWRTPAHIWKHIWRPSHSRSHNWHKTTNTSKTSYTMTLFKLYHHAAWTTESRDETDTLERRGKEKKHTFKAGKAFPTQDEGEKKLTINGKRALESFGVSFLKLLGFNLAS